MKLFDQIKEKAKNISSKIKKTQLSMRELQADLIVDKSFPKTSKKITGLLQLTVKESLKIKSISYTLREDVDPIVGKRKDEAEVLGKKQTKKGFTLTGEKEISFTLPISFSTSHTKNSDTSDMELLNHMSERSKRTSIAYRLVIEIRYLPKGKKESSVKKIQQTIHFE